MAVSDVAPRFAVVKLGGSVLTGLEAYRTAASFLTRETADGSRRLVAVVSAEYGHTDSLAREASRLTTTPDPNTLDLLWSTGELRSVALLTLALKEAGVPAIGLNAHEAGLRSSAASDAITFGGLAVRAALAQHAVVVVPGFLATRVQQIVTLGRGGSDLSAVLLAESLGADRCILIKDVDGYFTHDPATHNDAQPIRALKYTDALAMADAGCPLVQRQALAEAQRASVPLIVRSFTSIGTVVGEPLPARHLIADGSFEPAALAT